MSQCSSFPGHQRFTTEVVPFGSAAYLAAVAVTSATTLLLSGCGCIGGGSSFRDGSDAAITIDSLCCAIPAPPITTKLLAVGTASPTKVAFAAN